MVLIMCLYGIKQHKERHFLSNKRNISAFNYWIIKQKKWWERSIESRFVILRLHLDIKFD